MKKIPELTVLVTGSTSGLGKGVALELCSRGASLLLHGRDPVKLERTARDLAAETGNRCVKTYLADLALLADVRRLAHEVRRDNDQLDLLINNAGVGFGRAGAPRELSRDGFELRFAVNVLAPYVLTNLLLPLLLGSAPSRIVNVGSLGQAPVDLDDIMSEKSYTGKQAYRRSKTALAMITFDLAERLPRDQVTVNCLHPATYMDTAMVREARISPMSTVDDGVDAVLYLATSGELEGVTGRFFDQKERARAIAQAYDVPARERLRRISARLSGIEMPQRPAH